MLHTRLSSQSGVAIGVILFVLAMLALVATAYTASGNFTGSTITPERISREVRSQGELIKTKIIECYMNFSNVDHSGSGAPTSANYPVSVNEGTLVEALDCPTYGVGRQNLWTGQSSSVSLPPPSKGLQKWVYKNAGDLGGRCIRIQPETTAVTDPGIRQGMAEAAAGFSDMERTYDANSTSQRVIIWITRPSGSPHADCAP